MSMRGVKLSIRVVSLPIGPNKFDCFRRKLIHSVSINISYPAFILKQFTEFIAVMAGFLEDRSRLFRFFLLFISLELVFSSCVLLLRS